MLHPSVGVIVLWPVVDGSFTRGRNIPTSVLELKHHHHPRRYEKQQGSTVAAPTLIFSRGLQSRLFLMRAMPAYQQAHQQGMPDLPCGLQEELGRGVCVSFIIWHNLGFIRYIFSELRSLGTK